MGFTARYVAANQTGQPMRSKILLPLLLLASPAFAQEATPTMSATGFSQDGDAIPALPLKVMQAGGIGYINGGIGDEETRQVHAQAGNYNLHIMLSDPKGEYISNVHVRVLGGEAAVLDVADAGPYLYAKLPQGSYTLETTSPGQPPKQEAITIGATGTVKKHILYDQK